MKYIITRHKSPVIFSEAESHNDMAEVVGAISAGFVDIRIKPVVPQELGDDTMELTVHCYGASHTLGGLASRGEEDARLIKTMLNRY